MVEIIPKKSEKGIPLNNVPLFVAGALLLAVIFGYVIFLKFESADLLKIQDLEESISKVGTKQDRESESKVFAYDKRIKDLKILSASRHNSLEFFSNFESLIHPKVWISSFEFDSDEMTAVVSGSAPDFKTLEQQMIFIQGKKDIVESVELSDIELSEEGGADFSLTINFTPDIFNIPEEQ